MAGTASDVLTFLETLRVGGLLQPQTLSAMFKVQALTRGQAEGTGLGVRLRRRRACRPQSGGHAAGTGDAAMERGVWPQMVHRPGE